MQTVVLSLSTSPASQGFQCSRFAWIKITTKKMFPFISLGTAPGRSLRHREQIYTFTLRLESYSRETPGSPYKDKRAEGSTYPVGIHLQEPWTPHVLVPHFSPASPICESRNSRGTNFYLCSIGWEDCCLGCWAVILGQVTALVL